MLKHENCRHTPSRRSTLPGRFADHFWNGETPGAADDRVVCAHCSAEIAHPAVCGHPAVRIACLSASALAGWLTWLLLRAAIAAGWPLALVCLLGLGAAAGISLLLERAVIAFVLAAQPWRQIVCPAEDLPLHRSAEAARRQELRRQRGKNRALNALQICTLLLLGAKGGWMVMLMAAALCIVELATKREPRVLLTCAAAMAMGLLTTLLALPAAVLLLFNAAALTALFAVIALILEERL